MSGFTAICSGLDVEPALRDLAGADLYWMQFNNDALRYIPLSGVTGARLLTDELSEVWKLIDTALIHAEQLHGDGATLDFARVGKIPPGAGIPPHRDGLENRYRRYQIALVSEPGVALTIDGEEKCPIPGEAWLLDVNRIHSILNGSAVDRLAILFDTKIPD